MLPVTAAEATHQLQQATIDEGGFMHGQLGIRLLFEDLVLVEAWWEAKRKGGQKAKGELGKGELSRVGLGPMKFQKQ